MPELETAHKCLASLALHRLPLLPRELLRSQSRLCAAAAPGRCFYHCSGYTTFFLSLNRFVFRSLSQETASFLWERTVFLAPRPSMLSLCSKRWLSERVRGALWMICTPSFCLLVFLDFRVVVVVCMCEVTGACPCLNLSLCICVHVWIFFLFFSLIAGCHQPQPLLRVISTNTHQLPLALILMAITILCWSLAMLHLPLLRSQCFSRKYVEISGKACLLFKNYTKLLFKNWVVSFMNDFVQKGLHCKVFIIF